MIFLLPSKPRVKPAQAQVRTQVKNDAQPGPSLASPNKALDGALVTQPVLPIPDFRVAPRQSVRVVPSIVPSLPLPVRLPSGTWPARIVELWALVSLLLIARLATSFAILQVRKKNATQVSELHQSMERCLAACAVSRRVRIAVVKEGDSPMVAGPFGLCVLIPTRLLSALNDAELEQICLHEAAHVARYDDWALLLQRTVEALFVFHPVVRWIARQIDLEREIACDDFVISATGKPRPYASCLTHVAELAVGYSSSSVAASVIESSHLTRRINMLLDKTRHTGTHILKLRFGATLAALSLLTWFAGKSPIVIARVNSTAGAHPGMAIVHMGKSTENAEAPAAPDPQGTGRAAGAIPGTVTGTVYDQNGFVVPNAFVSISALPRRYDGTVNVKSDAAGNFKFTGLPAGDYELEVEALWFHTYSQPVTLQTARDMFLNPKLTVGGFDEGMFVYTKAPPAISGPPSYTVPTENPALQAAGDLLFGSAHVSSVTRLDLLRMDPIIYPQSAKASGVGGTVVLSVVIAADGTVSSLKVANTQADPTLAQAAVDAIRQWVFIPPLLDGQPIETDFPFTVYFLPEPPPGGFLPEGPPLGF
jgi:TonB family protein